jgi:hypothetical protein
MPPARAAAFCLLFVGITKRRAPAGAHPGGFDLGSDPESKADPDPDPDFDFDFDFENV